MGNIFSGSEIVELGIQIEKNGRDFYGALVKQSKNQDAIDIFKFLAAQEEKHIATFQGLLNSTNKYEPPENYQDEYVAYMRSLAAECIFTKEKTGEEIAKHIKNEKEAVIKGIEFEKDSIVFYDGIKKVVPADEQKIIDELILEEQRHLMQLVELKRDLK